MRIVFFGSDDFAAAHLQDLIASSCDVVGCVTQPDRPKGRGMKMNVSPIKVVALDKDIPVLQPASLTDADFCEQLRSWQAEVFVVIAYGRFLPAELLEMPAHGAINLHPSLLPRYRGAAPINWAIVKGDTTTGISIIRLNTRMDAGDVIGQVNVPIGPRETAVTLREKMIPIGCALLKETLGKMHSGYCPGQMQDSDQVSLAPKLTKADGRIDWSAQTASEIENLVRGLLPWPAAYTRFQDKTIKLLETAADEGVGEPGTIVAVDKDHFSVAAREGRVKVLRLQPESGKVMSAAEFIRGYHLHPGQRVGD